MSAMPRHRIHVTDHAIKRVRDRTQLWGIPYEELRAHIARAVAIGKREPHPNHGHDRQHRVWFEVEGHELAALVKEDRHHGAWQTTVVTVITRDQVHAGDAQELDPCA